MSQAANAAVRPLSVELVRLDPSWRSLLDSEGIAWTEPRARDASRGEVLVVPSGTSGATLRACTDRVRNGATGIFEERLPKDAAGPQDEPIVFPYDAPFFRGLTDPQQTEPLSVRRGRWGRGRYFVLPFRLRDLWPDHRLARRHMVFDEASGLRVFEFTARVVKKNVRLAVAGVLRQAFFDRGLPFAKKWYWPGRQRSVFCLRGDADGEWTRTADAYLDAVGGHPECASIYFCAGKYRSERQIIRRARELDIEIGSHNYWHIVFRDRWTNGLSLARAEAVLRGAGVRPLGFVSPAYFWHPSLYRVLERRGYEYAASFGFDQDNVPYFPVVGGRVSSVLEVGSHCVGDRYVKFDVDLDGPVARTFFENLISKKYLAAEPMMPYGHVDMVGRLGTAPNLVRFIRERALRYSDVLPVRALDLARWWRRRAEFSFRPGYREEERAFVLDPASKRSADVPRISVETPEGKWFLLDPSTCVRPGQPLDGPTSLRPPSEPRPTDVGEVVFHTPEGPPPDASLRRRLRRYLKAYAAVYLHDPDADAKRPG